MNNEITLQLVSLTTLALGEYAQARRLMRSDADISAVNFNCASDHAMQAGMLVGEHDLARPDELTAHVGLRSAFEKGRLIGYELGHPVHA